MTLSDAATEWLRGARDGTIRNRSGDPYKPSAVRAYKQQLERRVLPALGGRRLADVRRSDVQDLGDKLVAAGLAPSTVQCSILPLRAIYRRAVARGEIAVNPTSGIEVPAVRGGRDRIASPQEARQLLDALSVEDRPLWATAMYAGLRLGELQALKWENVDLDAGTIRVEQGWDRVENRAIDPKSRVGRRRIPIASVLRSLLLEHRLRCGRRDGLVFGRTAVDPFTPTALYQRAKKAWQAAELDPITLHQCRHTAASLMIAAGLNAKALSEYMGHSSIQVTFDKYGHLMPGYLDEAAQMLDAFLSASA
ncbi:MAG: site-specific integrase [Chloroflexota bacterium]|nr:site-specific integrase [Chloroflexota bacterium]